MKFCQCLSVMVFFLLATGSPLAATEPFPGGFLSGLQGAIDEGELTVEEALLCKFQYLFAPENLPLEWRLSGSNPLKCGSFLVREFQEMRAGLPADVAAEISSYLEPLPAQAMVPSASGRFQLSYSVTGENAVPALDIDPANGVPDFVDRVAIYLEQAWEAEIVEGGFSAPVSLDGTYPVSFQAMAAYGYTAVEDPVTGATRIVLHNNFDGFPLNDDPEGDRWGAAKVTAAHELKHASQYAASRWSEAGWIELDAVWAEELVFDEVNDYYNFLMGESPLRRPDLSLDAGGSGSYEDAVFQIWLQQSWGVEIIRDFWTSRQEDGSGSVMGTWEQVLGDRGMTLAEAWAHFTAWNYGTDLRAAPLVGYSEARDYPCGSAEAIQMGQPFACAGSVEHLAARNFRLDGFQDVGECGIDERLEVVLQGSAEGGPLTLAVHITRLDGTGLVETAVLGNGLGLRHLVGVPWPEIRTVGLAVGNASPGGPARAFELGLDRVNLEQKVPLLLDALALTAELSPGKTTSRQLTLSCPSSEESALNFTAEICGTDPREGQYQSDEAGDLPNWLDCFPINGVLEPGDAATLSLEFSSDSLAVDNYGCWLSIGAEGYSEPVVIPVTLKVVPVGRSSGPVGGMKMGSHPNPFNPVTFIRFELPAAAVVQVDVLDLRGRVVCRLMDGPLEAGPQRVAWNGRDDQGAPLGAGLYLARLQTGGRPFTCKMILAK